MLRPLLLAASVLALAGSASSIQQFDQRGTVAAPRAPRSDGQPMAERSRLEVHGGITSDPTGAGSSGRVTAGTAPADDSASAVAKKQLGGALELRAGDNAAVAFEVEGAWSPHDHTIGGAPITAPTAVAISATTGLRLSGRLSDSARLGVAADVGGMSVPIVRSDRADTDRDWVFVGRLALIPSVRHGNVTVFGSAGLATEAYVPPTIVYDALDGDPGVQAEARGVAFVLGAGATVDTGGGTRITARIGDAWSDRTADGHYGLQADVGLSLPLAR